MNYPAMELSCTPIRNRFKLSKTKGLKSPFFRRITFPVHLISLLNLNEKSKRVLEKGGGPQLFRNCAQEGMMEEG